MSEADAAHLIEPHLRLVDLISDGIQPPARATVRRRWSSSSPSGPASPIGESATQTARTTRALHAPVTADGNVRINTDALQIALLIPLLAGLVGVVNSFRMIRIPEPAPPASDEGPDAD
ncbi:hypothetical protein P3H15_51515 [Rhodococcus sp. T2V]|uniref:hypothetical protein n=1 Tax=Rhodococcus sp. T2V TaxID=3034164 RepID=UPI0023E27043|nr:hypothetical protein [Rhodococcus sp. T2V]MDF3313346.1 hypothetical protein [Rhodococcus sp. T2V]